MSLRLYSTRNSRYGRRTAATDKVQATTEEVQAATDEGVSDEVLSERPISREIGRKISRMIDIRGTVKLLGKGKLEFNHYPRL